MGQEYKERQVIPRERKPADSFKNPLDDVMLHLGKQAHKKKQYKQQNRDDMRYSSWGISEKMEIFNKNPQANQIATCDGKCDERELQF